MRLDVRVPVVCLLAASTLACGDDVATSLFSSAAPADPTGDPGGTTTPTTTPTSGATTSDVEPTAGSGTVGMSVGTTTDLPTTGATTSSSTTTTTTATTGAVSASTGTGEPDTTGTIDTTTGCEGIGRGDIDFSYLWVANSNENTVSKINTFTVVEEGRYLVHPPGIPGGSPSRTSVNLHGDVAIANRCNVAEPVPDGCAGVTKIAARKSDCVDLNNDGQITTSTGPNDVKPYGQDECVLWHTPFKARSNRPVAWTAGELDPFTCTYENPRLWTVTSNDGDDTSVKVYLLDGADGSIDEEIVVAGWQGDGYAVYGGAVDSVDDFWFVGGYSNQLGHVRISDLSYEVIPSPGTPYGTMVDNKDRPWLLNGQLNRYDPATKTWKTADCGGFACTSITQDGDGNVWVGGVPIEPNPARLLKVDPETMQIVDTITGVHIPEIDLSWGLATDVEGYLWAVENGTQAFKIDRTNYTYEIFQNISSMYTYSDMTGFGLVNVQPQ